MATGGTIPSGRKQYVYFYNTHGVIEKDKQMYFAPIFNEDNEGEAVSEAFLELFEEVCPPSSAYSEIEISSWSPQDRTLVVKGNIDDFRLITDEGACLNYFLVKREVTKGEGQQASTATYYYAFFITGVEQVGGSSVRITAEPDDFTNVFYLHNTHVLTNIEAVYGAYEPFTERMKNCHVNRQHYDRVEFNGSYYILHVDLVNVEPGISLELGKQISIEFEDHNPKTVTGEIVGYDDSAYDIGDLYLEIKTDERVEIGQQENWSHIYYLGVTYLCEYVLSDIRWDELDNIVPANQNIFLNQEDSFRFKYQYRDERRPFAFENVFTEEELSIIKNTSSFASLSQELRKKILKTCIQYLVFEMKSQEKFMKIDLYVNTDLDRSEDREFSNNIKGFQKSCTNVFFPFMNVPDIFSKFESDISQWTFKWKLKNQTGGSWYDVDSATRAYRKLNKNSLADFVYSAYVVGDVGLPQSKFDYDFVNKEIHFICNEFYGNTSAKDLYIVPIDDNDPLYSTRYFRYVYSSLANLNAHLASSVSFTTTGTLIALMLSQYNERDISINISETIPNLKSSYYDPVLEAEPYSFYSLSYLAYEMPFNKNRYYQNMKIKFTYVISINGAIKLSYIPIYTVESKEYKYYNECLTFTIPSSLPMVSDSYSTYYYQNKAQMKNQFAVNEYNRGFDIAQHIFLGGPSRVGATAITKGGYGALAETVNQWGQIADEALDVIQSTEVIEMNQKSKIADVGAKPDVVKQSGSDAFSDLVTGENRPFFNHYTIDRVSYNTIAKMLERFGYQVNLYDSLNTIDRVGWNFVKLNSFDWNPASQYDIMIEQEESIKKIFLQGVTLLHNPYYLTAGHNYEVILD